MYMPAIKATKTHKFARPFEGPYRITAIYDNGADVRLVDQPSSNAIRVALDRLRHCPAQITSLEGQMRRKRGRSLGKKKKRRQPEDSLITKDGEV